MDIHIFMLRIAKTPTAEEQERLLRVLPRERRIRLGKMKKRDKRDEVIFAYALLKYAVKTLYGIENMPKIQYADTGKPYFPRNPRIHFSISHTTGAVACALHDRPVGVDIEQIHTVSEKLLRRFGVDSLKDFFDEWVCRESEYKRSGIGSIVEHTPTLRREYCRALDSFDGYAAGASGDDGSIIGSMQTVDVAQLLRDLQE